MRRALMGLTVAASLLAAATAHPATGRQAYEASEHFFPSGDGTMLHADVFRPTGVAKTPVILLVTPYRTLAAPTGQPRPAYQEFQQFLAAGYAVHQVSLRGYGESEGCGDFGGRGEQMDAVAAVEWSASRPWSTGKVGMFGISYDGWTQIMAMANEAQGLTAAVVSSPLISLYRGLYMNGIHYETGWHATPAAYSVIDLISVGPPGNDPSCYVENEVETANDDPSTIYWRERDLERRAARSRVPVFWTHGFRDANTKPDNFLDVYARLRGPRQVWVGQFPHAFPTSRVGDEVFIEHVIAFFDRHLRQTSGGPYEGAVVQDGNGNWRAEPQWPPPDTRRHRLRLNDGSYEDIPGTDAHSAGTASTGIWTFTQTLPYDLHFAGVPEVKMHVAAPRPGAHVIVLVYDVDPSGLGRLITRGAYKVRGEGAIDPVDADVTFELYPQDWVLERGHRLGVFVAGADDAWFDPGHTGALIEVRDASITLPFLRFERDAFIESRSPGQWFATSIPSQTIDANERRGSLPKRMKKRSRS